MSSNHDKIKKCVRSRKILNAGLNVLGFCEIKVEGVQSLIFALNHFAKIHNIKKDGIFFEL